MEKQDDEDLVTHIKKSCLLEQFKEIDEVKNIISSVCTIYNDQIAVERALERFQFIIDQYQEQPHLLDPHLEKLCSQILTIVKNQDIPTEVILLSFQLFYHVTKTRGYKVIVRMMPHEVADLEPVLALLSKLSPTDLQSWTTRYMLFLWLSIVVMIPFDMYRLDGDISGSQNEKRLPIMQRILNIGKTYLNVVDKSRDSAAYMLSKFLTRPDVKKLHLSSFVDWALVMMSKIDMKELPGQTYCCGILSVLASLYKYGKRDDVVEFAALILQRITELNMFSVHNTVLRKLTVKLTQRLGLSFLKARLASWRYQRGSRSLADNLMAGKQVAAGTCSNTDNEGDEDYDVPEEIEDVIEKLLSSLTDKDTVVRWSAAKGIGRITARLPRDLADEVVGSVLEILSASETENAWHGGCLTLAELGRRGLLLPSRLSDVVPIIVRALVFDEKCGNFSVGTNVRDAACYVCWSFARAYDASEVAPYVRAIASMLVIVSIFDREVNVRRAAAAAFQENVGRQGHFPHGIDILSTCDYFAVGNRSNCYLELSVFVAQFEEYTLCLIDHLVEHKIGHWDISVRDLAAKCLHKLTSKAPKYMLTEVLPLLLERCLSSDVNLHHGALLAVAHVLHALYLDLLDSHSMKEPRNLSDILDVKAQQSLMQLTSQLQEKRFFRGVGHEMMRQAGNIIQMFSECCFIEKCSVCKLPFHGNPVIELWQNFIDDCLENINPNVQASAVEAISVFFSEYYTDVEGIVNREVRDQILSKYLKNLESSVETTRSGYALALGALPLTFLTDGCLDTVLSKLVATTRITPQFTGFVISRQDALKALTSLCKLVGVRESGSDGVPHLSSDNVSLMYDSLFVAMKDYTLDSRGDVGAWVREAAMTGMLSLTSLVVEASLDSLSADISRRLFCEIMQQACEKIDRTRAHAGGIFAKLLYHSPRLLHIPHETELMATFPQTEIDSINWASEADTFPKFASLIPLPAYSYNILLGLNISAGGLTESLVKHAVSSLWNFFTTASSELVKAATDVLLAIFKDFQRVDRVTLPLLKSIGQLLRGNCFQSLSASESQEFALSLITLTRTEITRCRDVQKTLASIDLFCDILQFDDTVQKAALTPLMLLLCHNYPVVRKTSASKLYEAFITYDGVVPEAENDSVTTLLLETLWDEPVDTVRSARNELCDRLGIKRPVPVQVSRWIVGQYLSVSSLLLQAV